MRPMIEPPPPNTLPPNTLPPNRPLPVSALPPPLAALADPERPLARPERFVPGELIPVASAFLALLGGGAVGFGLFGAALYAWGTAGDDPAGRYVAPILAALAWARAAAGWLTLKRARAQRDQLDRGRWRRGLFVEDDGLLLITSGPDGAQGRWIPKSMVGEVDALRRPGRLSLHGAEPIEVPGEPSALAHRLAGWRQGRPFAWEERV